MTDLICPQCLLPNNIDCREGDCPKKLVPAAEVRPDLKLCQDMGRRIKELETLVVRAGNFFNGITAGAEGMQQDVVDEMLRIVGEKKKGGRVGHGAGNEH